MSRWSDRRARRTPEARTERRAQVEPLAALVAVFAVGVALSAYAGLLDNTLPTPDRNLAEPTVERAERAISEAGVADPDALSDALRAGPDGYRLNLTLESGGRTWHAGPTPPPGADATETADAASTADTASVAVSVRLAPGQIRPGELRAEVWA